MGRFDIADYAVFFATILISFLIGVFFAFWDRKKNTPLDYFLAGRQFSTLPAALSFIVTFQSSLLILGIPAEVYQYGVKYGYCIVGIVMAYTFAGITAVPVFHELKVTSVYKYFELRYGNNVVRYITMAGGIIYNVFYMGTVTYGTCVALEVVMGIPFWGTVIMYIVITATYTSIGGIKAVIWTDVFQLLVMVTGIVSILAKITINIGGPGNIFKAAANRLELNDFRVDPTIRYQFWNVTAGSFCTYLFCTYTQAGIQRINTTPTVKAARRLYLISGPLYAFFFGMTVFEGAALFAYHSSKGCDVVAAEKVKNVNEIVPWTVMDLFDDMPGLAGLFIASLSSAALSTLSSCLNSLSAITYEDILKVRYPNISDKKATRVSKLVVLGYGLLSMGLTFIISFIPGSVISIFGTFMGSMEGPSCAIFILSTMFRRSTTPGMVIGGLSGMAVSLWLALMQLSSNLPPYPTLPSGPTDMCYTNSSVTMATSLITPTASTDGVELSPMETFYSISFIMFSFIGFAVTIVVGVLVSLFTKPPKYIDERCLFSFRKHVLESGKEDKPKPPTAEDVKLMKEMYDVEIKSLEYRNEK